jgi:hypothetical protein
VLRSLQTNLFGMTSTVLVVALSSVVFLSGCAVPNQFGLAGQSNAFGQKIVYNTKVDVLFVVDNADGSMTAKMQQLSSGFSPFVNFLISSGFDFHVAVTTMDMSAGGAAGSFIGSPNVLANSTANVVSDFVTNASVPTVGSALQRGLQAVQTGLSSPDTTGVNAGFLRSDALLAIVFLADEDDSSPNNGSNGANYISFLNQLKPPFTSGAMSWVANSIVVTSLTDTNCKTYLQFSSPGYTFMDLSNASGGAIDSICQADLVSASEDIGGRILSILTAYHLSTAAQVSTIQVFINGVSIPQNSVNGWTYSSTGYTLTFHGTAVPPANANVQVSFTPVAANS